MRKFKGYGWCVGRVLKPSSDGGAKDQKRVANFRVFYEADDELLCQALYSSNYARDVASPDGYWMAIARRPAAPLALPAPEPELGPAPLALTLDP